MNRATRQALTGAAALLMGVATACSGSSGAAKAGTASQTVTASPTPTVTMSANPIVTPLTTPTASPTVAASSPGAAGDVPAGATLVARHPASGGGSAYVVYAEPRNGSFCLVLAVGETKGEQCVRAVPPANNLDVHTLRVGSTALLAGVTGASVAKVTVDTDDGSSVSVAPVALPGAGGKAFAAAVDPGTVSQVTAYDAAGTVVARS